MARSRSASRQSCGNLEALHARALSASLAQAPGDRGLRRRLRRCARALRRSGQAMYIGQAAAAEAALAQLAGRTDEVRRRWREAQEAFSAAGLAGELAAVRLRRAALCEDPEASDRLQSDAQGYFERQQIADPQKFMTVFAAG